MTVAVATPFTVNGTLTSRPDTALNCAVMVKAPADSMADCEGAVKVTVGVASSSLSVSVWVTVVPCEALTGVPISTMTVSAASSRASSAGLMVMVADVLPAAIDNGEAVATV